MRHQSLETTTKYLRTVSERMADAVKNLGAVPGRIRFKTGANNGAKRPSRNSLE